MSEEHVESAAAVDAVAAEPRSVDTLIVGLGPCGLGAAYRLTELGEEDWLVCERAGLAGGLSRSFQDEKGFWWDIGGHVIFSHYAYFDDVLESISDQVKLRPVIRECQVIYHPEVRTDYPAQLHFDDQLADRIAHCLHASALPATATAGSQPRPQPATATSTTFETGTVKRPELLNINTQREYNRFYDCYRPPEIAAAPYPEATAIPKQQLPQDAAASEYSTAPTVSTVPTPPTPAGILPTPGGEHPSAPGVADELPGTADQVPIREPPRAHLIDTGECATSPATAASKAVAAPPGPSEVSLRQWATNKFPANFNELFFVPYNTKVWAHPPQLMGSSWLGERVATVTNSKQESQVATEPESRVDGGKLDKTKCTIGSQRQDQSSNATEATPPDPAAQRTQTPVDTGKKWGPNYQLRYVDGPGGIGKVYGALASRLDRKKISYSSKLISLDIDNKIAHFQKQTEDADQTEQQFADQNAARPQQCAAAEVQSAIEGAPGERGKRRKTEGTIFSVRFNQIIYTGNVHELLAKIRPSSSISRIIANEALVRRTLVACSTFLVGVAITPPRAPKEASFHWAYFPDPHAPFHRCVNLSELNGAAERNRRAHQAALHGRVGGGAADSGDGASPPGDIDPPPPIAERDELAVTQFLFEISFSNLYNQHLFEAGSSAAGERAYVDNVIEWARYYGMIAPDDTIVSTWTLTVGDTYPVPTLGADRVATELVQSLQSRAGVYCRGRMAGWKYEVGNMDHSFMQGVEVVDSILADADCPSSETVAAAPTKPPSQRPQYNMAGCTTYFKPTWTNAAGKHPHRYAPRQRCRAEAEEAVGPRVVAASPQERGALHSRPPRPWTDQVEVVREPAR